jgi:D-alanyl-D-alanine carboxypeptidase (penicillin-binding protein 5/6)
MGRRRLVSLAILAALVLGLAGSAPAVPSRAGISGHRIHRGHRPSAPAPRGESLEVPWPGAFSEDLGFGPTEISASAAILVDARTGNVLFARNPDEPRAPASVTKILTALVILDHGRLAEVVQISRQAAQTGGHRLGLRAGQRLSLRDLLAAILIRSANDAAVAAAEHVGGSLSGFVALMNAKAQAIGMTGSRFANPHGLDEPDHFTTARDMATLSRVALADSTFAQLVRAREASVTVWKPVRRGLVPASRPVYSHNRLLGRLPGADGVKTGYTDGAGRCLVASASRGNSRMIAVLLNDPRRWTDAAALLEYGFETARSAARVLPGGQARAASETGWPRVAAQAGMEERP